MAKALVAGAVDNGNCRAVLNSAVAFEFLNRVARHRNRAISSNVQVARAHLRAHRLRVNRGVVDGQRSAAGEVNAEAVGNVERAVLQNNGVVCVVAVGLDAARGGGRGLNALERKGGVVVRDGAARGGRNQTDELRTHDLAVLHRERCVGVVDFERRRVRVGSRARPGMAVQVNRTSDASGVERATRGVVAQQGDGFAACGLSLERLVHGVVASFANLSKVRFFDTVRTVAVLSSGGTFDQIAGRIGAERTARDLDRRLCRVVGSGTRAVVKRVQRAIDNAARDGHLRRLAFGAVVSHRLNVTVDGAAADRQIAVVTAAVRPGRHRAVDRAALDGSSVPVLNGVAVGGIQRTAVQEQIAAINLDHNEVILGKVAALDIQAGILGDAVITHAHQGRALPAFGAAVVGYVAALEGEPAVALNVNDIVGGNAGVLCGVLTHDGTGLGLAAVHDGDASRDGQCRLALLGAAVEGVAVQVKRDVGRGDCDVFLRIGQQLHRCIARRSVNCRLQAGIFRAIHFRN